MKLREAAGIGMLGLSLIPGAKSLVESMRMTHENTSMFSPVAYMALMMAMMIAGGLLLGSWRRTK